MVVLWRGADHYMTQFGLPDESCQLYNATDHTKYKGQGADPSLRSSSPDIAELVS